MESARLGASGLHVSRVCLGTWQLGGGWGDFDPAEARATVRLARDLGIDFFDSARAYGWGASEAFLAEALGDEMRGGRADLVIATKGGLRMIDGALARDSRPESLRQDLEDSLRSLGTHYVDLYLVHWPDPSRPASETADVLASFVEEGLVRATGFSNVDVRGLEIARSGVEGGADGTEGTAAAGRVSVVQPPYGPLRRGIEAELLPWCEREDIGVMVYGPLAHGLLAGGPALIANVSADDWRGQSHVFRGPEYERVLRTVDVLRGLAEEGGLTRAQLAVGWTLSHPAVDVAIVGARRPSHLQSICEAPLAGLPAGLKEAVDVALRDTPDLDVASPEHL